MSKKKAADESTAPSGSVALERLAELTQRKFGSGAYTGSQAIERTICLEVYALAMQHLIDAPGLPLQSFVTFAGPPKTYKSSAALEFQRTFISPPANGMAVAIPTEGKYSPTKLTSLLGDLMDRLTVVPASSVSEWQSIASAYLNWLAETQREVNKAKTSSAKADPLLRNQHVPPMCISVDSVTGAQTESMTQKIIGDGETVGRAFQDRSLEITTFLNAWAANLTGLPVTVILTNHLKDSIAPSPNGAVVKRTPGGVALGFHTALDIRCRFGDSDKEKGGKTIKTIRWTVNFSSIGRDGRSINIPYIEGYDAQGNQQDYFDWDAALVRLIMELSAEPGMYPGLKDAYHIVEQSGKGGPWYSCEQLGISPKQAIEEKLTATHIGRLLQTDPAHRAALKSLLRVSPLRVWTPDVEFTPFDLKEKD